MLFQPLLVVFVPLDGSSSEHSGMADLDQPSIAKSLPVLWIITLSSENVNVEKTDRRQVGDKESIARWTGFSVPHLYENPDIGAPGVRACTISVISLVVAFSVIPW